MVIGKIVALIIACGIIALSIYYRLELARYFRKVVEKISIPEITSVRERYKIKSKTNRTSTTLPQEEDSLSKTDRTCELMHRLGKTSMKTGRLSCISYKDWLDREICLCIEPLI